jgi:nucleoside-diphosphate-sugar epimerase
MQTILGSGGVIANGVAKQLPQYTSKIRLVSRHPQKVNETDEVVTADLTVQDQVSKAIEGSGIVYLTAGLAYKLDVWEQQWPLIMENVINACKRHNARLVFFDNVYAYGKVDGWMREDTPYNPCSKKGEVRARIADKLMDEARRGNISALIARASDFYGPYAYNTFIMPMVFERLKQHKAASWLVEDAVKHSLTFTPDAAKATALLGNTGDAYNQIWHLPTDRIALTGQQIVEIIAECFSAPPKYSVLSKWMVKMAGIFNPLAKESYELLYQFESDFLLDSTKFENAFFSPTPYQQGVQMTAESMSVAEELA